MQDKSCCFGTYSYACNCFEQHHRFPILKTIPIIYCMPMLPLHVGWCLPLLIPSRKIALPIQKLTSYLALKLTTPTLPYPKTQQKIHNPQRSCVSTGSCWLQEPQQESDGDLAASQRVLQKNIRTISHVGTLRNKYIWIIQIKSGEFLPLPIDKTAYSTVGRQTDNIRWS